MRRFSKLVILLLVLIVSIVPMVVQAADWWDSSWTHRRTVTFNNSASGENLVNFPVLVKLTDPANIDYAYTQAAGQDIRFVDSDGSTILKHEIENWDEAGTSWVWVKVPQIDAGSTTDYIWMYYGNGSVADGQDAENVWDSNFVAVQHMKEDSGNIIDSTSNGLTGVPTWGGDNVNNCESLSDWTGTSIALDSSWVSMESVYSIKDTIAAPFADTTYVLGYNPAGSWDWSSYTNIKGYVYSDRGEAAFTYARLYLYDTDGDYVYWDITGLATWNNRPSKNFASPDGFSGTMTWTAVNYLSYEVRTADTVAFWLRIDHILVSPALVSNYGYGAIGKIGNAISFDSYDDTISLGNSTKFFTAVGTWEAFARKESYWKGRSGFGGAHLLGYQPAPTDPGSSMALVSSKEHGLYTPNVQSAGGIARVSSEASPYTWTGQSGANTAPAGSWHYTVLNQDGIAPKLYIDGSLVATFSSGNNLTSWTSSASAYWNFYISAGLRDSCYFYGIVDEVRVSNVTRAVDWIEAQNLSMTDAYITFGAEELVPANPPTGLTLIALDSYQVDGAWTLGDGAILTEVRRQVGSYPTTRTDGVQVYSGSGTSFSDNANDIGLELDKTVYYYRAWSQNALGGWSSTYDEGLIGGTAMLAIAIVVLVLSITTLAFVVKSGMLYAACIPAWMFFMFYMYHVNWPTGNTYLPTAITAFGSIMVLIMVATTAMHYIGNQSAEPSYDEEKATNLRKIYDITKKKDLW